MDSYSLAIEIEVDNLRKLIEEFEIPYENINLSDIIKYKNKIYLDKNKIDLFLGKNKINE